MICARVQPAGWPYSWHSSAASTISTVMYGGSPLERSLRSRIAPEPEDRARNLGRRPALRGRSTARRTGIPAKGPAAAAAAAAALPLLPSLRRGRRRPCGLPPDCLECRPRPYRRRAAFSAARPRRRARPSPGQAPSRPFSASDGAGLAGGRRAPLPATLHAPLPGPDGVRRPFELVGVLRLPFGGCGDRFLSGTRPPSERGRADVPFLADVRRQPAFDRRPLGRPSALRPKATRAGVTFRGPCWPPCPVRRDGEPLPRLTPGLRSPRRSCRTMRFLRRRPLRP